MRIVLLGPPGSGKGTQAVKLGGRLGVPQTSTGDLLREAIAGGTAMGKKASSFVRAGVLVPDELMFELLAEHFEKNPDVSGFILDGFPRTVRQAEGLEKLLDRRGVAVEKAVYIRVADETIVKRLSARRVCPRCGRNYNLITMRPKMDGRCDACGVELEQRADDTERTVRKRLEVYREETSPVVEYYRRKGILLDIDGEGTAEETFQRILANLGVS